MKYLSATALLCLLAASPAFAQSAPGAQPAMQSAAAVTSNATPQNGQWVPPYGQPVMEKTRAQVYQELVQAEQDGQLAYLNSTVYAHH